MVRESKRLSDGADDTDVGDAVSLVLRGDMAGVQIGIRHWSRGRSVAKQQMEEEEVMVNYREMMYGMLLEDAVQEKYKVLAGIRVMGKRDFTEAIHKWWRHYDVVNQRHRHFKGSISPSSAEAEKPSVATAPADGILVRCAHCHEDCDEHKILCSCCKKHKGSFPADGISYLQCEDCAHMLRNKIRNRCMKHREGERR
jgi:hypothetical protein